MLMRVVLLALTGLAAVPCVGQTADVKPVDLTMDDQFDAKQELKSLRGQVVVLIYGDRKATDACRALGETVHVAFHPSAKGQPPEKARLAPVTPIANALNAPGVRVIPVACVGKVPGVVKNVLQTQIRKAQPDVPVWLDCQELMQSTFGLTTGEPNLVILDPLGRLRHTHHGQPDTRQLERALGIVHDLRVESAKPAR